MPSSTSSTNSSSVVYQRPRTRRSRSPVSLYVAGYGLEGPKEPKPLVKLPPKGKNPSRSGTLSSLKSVPDRSPSSSFDSQMSLSGSSSRSGKSPTSSITGSFFGLGRRKSLVKSPPPPLPLRPSIPSFHHQNDTPTSTSFQPPTATEIKQHQLDKVSRTLGEKIPPSLIFGHPIPGSRRSLANDSPSSSDFANGSNLDSIPPTPLPSVSTHPPSAQDVPKASPTDPRFRRPRTAPSPTTPTFPDSTAESAVPPHVTLSPSISKPLRMTPSPAPSTNSSNGPLEDRINVSVPTRRSTEPLQPLSKTQPSGAPSLKRARTVKPLGAATMSSDSPHKHSHSDEIHLPRHQDTSSLDDTLKSQRPQTPFADSYIPAQEFLSTNWTSKDSDKPTERRDRKQGWSGEWNCEDMQDVIQKLRNLK
ncbi:hypothetical protein K435DRAFT_346894 [Dendrothele bispora CBS 962.96]|uniref:Uncharacterized protein n=1 Tax=Dendrothele bispora (strain CBS 962.96) TaxID=1314807 RepID=A0A4V4HDH8_DENBC|nr:hypothetical protein K435DRAFT_346894 [Dendrothele bispora CBS 962.96]